MAHRAAEEKALTATKLTLRDELEEDWDEELLLPPRETPPGVRLTLPSQEDEWKLMVDQDLCSRPVAGDSGHGTMATTVGTEPVNSNEVLIGAIGRTDENVSTDIALMLSGRKRTY